MFFIKNKKLFFLFVFPILILFVLEMVSFFSISVRSNRNYRNLHCFYKNYLFLCPNRQASILRKDGLFWELSTNPFGERITPRTTLSQKYSKEIWFIGDSISLGYLVDDTHTTPYLLDQSQDIAVRNLGVDSIGTLGILNRLQLALKHHPKIQIYALFWIYNTSDFTDDIKEQSFKINPILPILFKTHYTIGKYSYFYNMLLLSREKRKNIVPETLSIDKDIINKTHITFRNIKILYQFIKRQKRIRNFYIIIYPGMDIKTKQADLNSPITQSVYEFLKDHHIPVIDVRHHFAQSSSPVYFSFDGHPNENGYKIFNRIVISLLKHL